ncbi:MAG TPA: tRNA (guanosine(46)-N7)-methyltransferase TrmB [Verrucomicrobiae bacterium]|nr:tRNA (guanosine(46)-N7)-methyltransferase TrmB [Verrucomicrobiae bacterium]
MTSLIYRPACWVEHVRLEDMFPVARPLEVELGSGDGSFLAEWAKRWPERNFIGVERLLGRLRKLDRKALRAGLVNVRLMRIEAGYFLEFLLPPASTSMLHVYFPDPWPKRKHHKHRLVKQGFPALAARVLTPGGLVCFRTDDPNYLTQIQEVFAGDARFVSCPVPPSLLEHVTDFEREFQARGIATLHAAYCRCERSESLDR